MGAAAGGDMMTAAWVERTEGLTPGNGAAWDSALCLHGTAAGGKMNSSRRGNVQKSDIQTMGLACEGMTTASYTR